MQTWFQFYAVIGGAAAALLGLLFVAVSINAAAALSEGHERSRRLAEQAYQNYLTVMLVSLIALFPGMNTATFGLVIVSLSGVRTIWVLVRLYFSLAAPTDDDSRLYALRRHLSSLVGFTMLMVTAFRMAMKYGDDQNLFASANIILLFSATEVSWELLTRIAKARRAR